MKNIFITVMVAVCSFCMLLSTNASNIYRNDPPVDAFFTPSIGGFTICMPGDFKLTSLDDEIQKYENGVFSIDITNFRLGEEKVKGGKYKSLEDAFETNANFYSRFGLMLDKENYDSYMSNDTCFAYGPRMYQLGLRKGNNFCIINVYHDDENPANDEKNMAYIEEIIEDYFSYIKK